MMDLSGKNVLMFAPSFFGYQNKIKEKLEQLGNRVDLFDERPNNDFWSKAILRLDYKLYAKHIEKYYNLIYEKVKNNKYDFVWIIKAESITPNILDKFRMTFKEARFVLYLWDSIKNIHGITEKLRYFDRMLSFDREDCISYPQFKFRPLFYIDDLSSQNNLSDEPKYDLCFIGTAHEDRPRITLELSRQCKASMRDCFVYLYSPHKAVYYINKIFNRAYSNVKISDIHFTPISHSEIKKIMSASRCILDIQHPKQTGLTMRTIECIGMRKKIVTTNRKCVDYDFYHPNNVAIINREHPVIDECFFNTPYILLDEEVYKYYSIDQWLNDILKTTEDK